MSRFESYISGKSDRPSPGIPSYGSPTEIFQADVIKNLRSIAASAEVIAKFFGEATMDIDTVEPLKENKERIDYDELTRTVERKSDPIFAYQLLIYNMAANLDLIYGKSNQEYLVSVMMSTDDINCHPDRYNVTVVVERLAATRTHIPYWSEMTKVALSYGVCSKMPFKDYIQKFKEENNND